MKLYAAAIATLAFTCYAGEPIELEYKFDNDKPIPFEMIQEMNQVQKIQGQVIEVSSRNRSLMNSQLIETNKDGSVLIGNTTESIHFTLSAPGMELDYDSTIPADKSKLSNPTIASVAGMVGIGVQLLISPDGAVLDVPNIDELTKFVDAMEDPAVQATVRPMMEKNTLIALNEMNYRLLPEEPVESGDQWNRVFDVPFEFGIMTTSFDLTLDSVKNGVALISITGSMAMPPISQQSITVTMDETSVNGSMKFNINDGVADFFELTSVSGMIGKMDGMPDPILEMTMTQIVKNTRLDN